MLSKLFVCEPSRQTEDYITVFCEEIGSYSALVNTFATIAFCQNKTLFTWCLLLWTFSCYGLPSVTSSQQVYL